MSVMPVHCTDHWTDSDRHRRQSDTGRKIWKKNEQILGINGLKLHIHIKPAIVAFVFIERVARKIWQVWLNSDAQQSESASSSVHNTAHQINKSYDLLAYLLASISKGSKATFI